MPHHLFLSTRLAGLVIVLAAGTSASAQLLQLGTPGEGLVITNSSGAMRMVAANVAHGATFGQFNFTLYGTVGNTYTLFMPDAPGGPTLGIDLISISGGSMAPTGNPLQFDLTPTSPFMTFNVFIFNEHQFVDGSLYPQISFGSTAPGSTTHRFNVPLSSNPNAFNASLSLIGTPQTNPVDLLPGGSISGGAGGGVFAPVTSAPGSTINATGGSLTLGNGTSQVNLNGAVNVAGTATLNINSSGPAMLGGQTEVNHGTIQVQNGAASGQLVFGSTLTQSLSDQLSQLLAGSQTQFIAGQGQVPVADIVAFSTAISAAHAQIIALQNQAESPLVTQQIQLLQAQQAADAIQMQQRILMLQGITEGVTSLMTAATSTASVMYDPLVETTRATIRSTLDADVTLSAATMNIGGTGEIDHTDVIGSFTVRTGAVLNMEFAAGGVGLLDTMTVTGDAVFELGSILQFDLLTLSPELSPAFLETFDILTADSITLNGLVMRTNDPSGALFFPSVIDNPDGTQTLRLTAVPTPAGASLLAAAALTAGRRRRHA